MEKQQTIIRSHALRQDGLCLSFRASSLQQNFSMSFQEVSESNIVQVEKTTCNLHYFKLSKFWNWRKHLSAASRHQSIFPSLLSAIPSLLNARNGLGEDFSAFRRHADSHPQKQTVMRHGWNNYERCFCWEHEIWMGFLAVAWLVFYFQRDRHGLPFSKRHVTWMNNLDVGFNIDGVAPPAELGYTTEKTKTFFF